MADNAIANPGAGGVTLATDDVAGVHYPISKLAWGPLDTVNHVDDADGKRFPVHATIAPATSGGLSRYHAVLAASNNAANIKASAGQVYAVRGFNNATYPIYIKLHNTAGAPTGGVGVVETIGIQAGTQFLHELDAGDEFTTGIGITVVQGIADNDNTAVALNDGVIDVFYK